MGVSPNFKKWLRKRYPDAWVLRPTNNEQLIREKGHPRRPPITIFDYMYIVKYLTTKGKYGKGGKREDDPITTGHKYFLKQFMPDISDAYASGSFLVYVCFDRGSPPNKSEEHQKRYSSRAKMKTPDDPNEVIIDDITMPKDWSKFSVNRELMRELIHYLTIKLVSSKPLSKITNYVFIPPQNCTLCIHGGRLDKPKRHCPQLNQPPSSRLHTISYKPVTLPSSEDGIKRMKYVREHTLSARNTDNFRENLLEGEMACLYYHRCHPNDDLMIVSSDGDLLILLLLASRDRIDPETGKFRNKVFLKLRSTQSAHDYVDINGLWWDIHKDKYFQQAGISDPVLYICALSCIIQNDYIHNFVHGLRGGVHGRDTDNVCPWIIYTFMNNIRKYKDMIKTKFKNISPYPSNRGDLNRILEIDIDEELFIQFTKDCYIEKYKMSGPVKKKYGDNPTHEDMRTHLKNRKNRKNRMMTAGRIRVTCRQLLWVLLYWSNGYRNDCSFTDPTATFRGLSYYGWKMAGINVCKTVNKVSIHCSDINGICKPWSPNPHLQWENREKKEENKVDSQQHSNNSIITQQQKIIKSKNNKAQQQNIEIKNYMSLTRGIKRKIRSKDPVKVHKRARYSK